MNLQRVRLKLGTLRRDYFSVMTRLTYCTYQALKREQSNQRMGQRDEMVKEKTLIQKIPMEAGDIAQWPLAYLASARS